MYCNNIANPISLIWSTGRITHLRCFARSDDPGRQPVRRHAPGARGASGWYPPSRGCSFACAAGTTVVDSASAPSSGLTRKQIAREPRLSRTESTGGRSGTRRIRGVVVADQDLLRPLREKCSKQIAEPGKIDLRRGSHLHVHHSHQRRDPECSLSMWATSGGATTEYASHEATTAGTHPRGLRYSSSWRPSGGASLPARHPPLRR